nr:hypothetical protein [Candidatus Sigynarchaeum springense]
WEILLGEACIIVCLVFAIYYFHKARKTEANMSTLKQLNYGMGILFLFLPIAILFTALGFVAFAAIPLIYWVLAGKTTGDLKRNAILLGFGFIFILVNIHTVGHSGSGYWYRSAICLIGFLFVGLGNRNR